MRPLKLTLSAFGPFPNQEVIDFSLLGHSPFFLINGPTGSGKSTILDAICYALYGSTTGNERTGDQMRSDLADPNTVTQVCFEFELGNQHFRIERKPEQWLPKLRGDGLTQHKHSATLEQLNQDDWQTLAVKPIQVNQMINELIGLSADQFRQVMVIPQGKFRDLLLASSKDREQIFGQLFSTHVYSRLENALAEKAGGIRKAKDSFDQQLKGILDLVSVDNEAQLKQAISTITPDLALATKECDQLARELSQAKLDHQQQVNLVERFALRDKLSQQIALNEKQRPGVELSRELRDKAVAAEKIAHLNKARLESEQKLVTLSKTLADLRQQKSALSIQLEQAEISSLNAQKALEDKPKRQQTLFELEQQRIRVGEIEKLQNHIAQLTAQQTKIDCEISDKQAAQLRYQAKLNELELQSKQATDAQQNLALVRLDLEKLSPLKKLFQQVNVFHKQQTELKVELEITSKIGANQRVDQQKAVMSALTLERQWLLNQAAELAKQLDQDSPCSVCGSTQHPAPAQFSGDVVTKGQVDAARVVASESGLKLKDVENKIRFLNQEIARVNKELSAVSADILVSWQGTEQALDEQIGLLNAQILELARLDLPTILQRLEKGKLVVEQGVELLRSLDKQREFNTIEMTSSRAQLDTLTQEKNQQVTREQINAEIENTKLLIAKLEQNAHKTQQEALSLSTKLTVITTQLASTEAELLQWQTQHNENQALWQQALENSQFVDEQAYQSAYKQPTEIEKLSQEIKAFDDLQAKLHSQLEQVAAELLHLSLPNLSIYEQKIAIANEHFVARSKQLSDIKSEYDALNNAHTRLEILKQKNQQLENEYTVLGTLSDVANGKNHLRISLHRFVLGVLLDDVLIQASARLDTMSFGRYRLIRKNERNKGNASSGLDLLVEDSYTSKTRDVATLSGGESFIAALSLALALSDVVQAHSGGVRLDTLFIDEGFGSLDSESLDQAMQTLIELQKGGRTIGIISHVNELKEQMECRIDIQHGQNGSIISLVS
jgi:exonuclease SbcC